MTITANPLYQFRAPKKLRNHPHKEGSHFVTPRGEVVNDTGALNVYPGMFKYIPDPTLEVDIAIWEDMAGDMRAQAHRYNMQLRESYEVMNPDQWEVVDEVAKGVWKPDGTGRLTAFGATQNALVLMFRTGDAAEAAMHRRAKDFEAVDKSPEQLQAELQEKYAPLDATVGVRETVATAKYNPESGDFEDIDEEVVSDTSPKRKGKRR